MPQVVIQPSYGNRDAWRHWEDTLDQELPFANPPYSAALTDAERAALDALHPTGSARFWGATGNHDRQMATLRTGDVILFTGRKLVRAVGEVGHSFRNATFADHLWDAHHERGSYHNVYSLLSFQPTDIPYEEVWDLPGFNVNDNFMGLRFLDADKGAAIIGGLGIATATSLRKALDRDLELAAELVLGDVMAVEAVNTAQTSYDRPSGTVLVRRAEALLVQAYRRTITGSEVGRLRTPTGITDLYVSNSSGPEIVEAKSGAQHQFVREALAQLLDYVRHAPQPVERLSAFFPDAPAESDVAFLHAYGIDVIHRNHDGTFHRDETTDVERSRMLKIWRP